jgi:hypothetical protein
MVATVERGHRLLWSRTLPGILAALERAEASMNESPAGNGALEKERDDGAHLTP